MLWQRRPLHYSMALENCSRCRGTGWKLVARTDGTARDGCRGLRDCGMEDRATRTMERVRIPKRYEHCDFEAYVTDLTDGKTWSAQHSQSLKQAKMLTQAFVRDYPGSAEKGLLLMGPSGVGKTHLAVASLKELIRRGHAGLFCDYRELLKEIQSSYNPSSESTEMSILEPVRTVEILVMDDLGASKPSAWVLDIIGLVLNARYNERRVTILTTATMPMKRKIRSLHHLCPAVSVSQCGKIPSRTASGIACVPAYMKCARTVGFLPDNRREVRQTGRARA